MERIVLYMHAGSGNHGCEAIVNSVAKILGEPIGILSVNVTEDLQYSLKKLSDSGRISLLQERHFKRYRPIHILYYIYRKITKDRESFIRYRYHKVFNNKELPELAISIGGDNYCYDIMTDDLVLMNSAFNQKGIKTILLGCSVEPELLRKPEIIADMLRYHMIIARESITYEALKKINHPRLYLLPDPAFALGKKDLPLPEGFSLNNTVGINLSPLVLANEEETGITMDGYRALIKHIIKTTDMQIALIPHVVWERNDDRIPLRKLYDEFAPSGRVVMFPDASCEELKGYIARLKYFIGARTHATIAAYSSLVPTLVIGYSVKARGIAVDIFGTDENYVIPVQALKKSDDIIRAFNWIQENQANIREKLSVKMPGYIKEAMKIGALLNEVM
ncbi:MAG: polysaccharide pyruvyl transferase family protein [Lachnospiraceae bacterium]|nr:polysaccharide pyruvyl transferase family protein [Lachnospiraceae bacterium]